MDYVQTCHQVRDFIGHKQNEYMEYIQWMINIGTSIAVAQAPVDNPEKLRK